MFKEVNSNPDFTKNEEEILKFWQENKIFEKSLEKNKDKKFVFYEGPPTANGRPGIHHILARVYKDIICRYKTMRGFKVLRRAGWDTHGLPVEIKVEKSLGLKNKKEIEEYGVGKFNEKCRMSVFRYKKEWEELTERIGFWLDLKNPYITYENSYIEKVWGVLKQIWDKNLIYQDFKVVPYCPRCGTTLSSHEVAQGYRTITEDSFYIKFSLKDEKNKYFLVWTTTPWTLPGNIALAINPEISYVEVETSDGILILAKNRLKTLEKEHKILREFKGDELVGKSYKPLYDASEFIKVMDKDYKIYSAEFVTAEDGTGIVHIAPAFGIDDMNLREKNSFSIPITVSTEGKMLTKIGKDKFVKDADQDIIEDLKTRQLFYKDENITHEYPFCWRCESILIYYAKTTWFIKVSKIKDELLKNNKTINWIPPYIKDGRFGEWLRDARDWALSRERFWGTPLPVWQCECGDKIIIGSIEELKKLSLNPIDEKNLDLHKPDIDKIEFKCPKCDSKMKRVPEVIDVWFDSGAMPFASGVFPDNFPADYISEAIDQTRGWFYTMLAISTLLENGAPYKNVICLAHVLDEHGKKMSKSKGNVIDPWEIINKFGIDSLRWYFFTVNSPGDPKRMAERDVEQILRKFNLILWNVYSFFIGFANLDNWSPSVKKESQNILDRWILSELNQLIENAQKNLEKYNVVIAARDIHEFVTDLSTWYLRRSRKRRDEEFYSTLYEVLINLTKLLAPFIPFMAESIYQNLKTKKDLESIHLCDFPTAKDFDQNLISKMSEIRKLAELAHSQRAVAKIRTRQPLGRATIKKELPKEFLDILKDEINVKIIVIDVRQKEEIILDTNITDELKKEGIYRDILRVIQDLRKKADLKSGEETKLYFDSEGLLLEIINIQKENIQKETAVILIEKKDPNLTEHKIGDQIIRLGIAQ